MTKRPLVILTLKYYVVYLLNKHYSKNVIQGVEQFHIIDEQTNLIKKDILKQCSI